jgi:hypothetical protein
VDREHTLWEIQVQLIALKEFIAFLLMYSSQKQRVSETETIIRDTFLERNKIMSQWQMELQQLLEQLQVVRQQKEEKAQQQQAEIKQFFALKVIPAFQVFKCELEKYGRVVNMSNAESHASLQVMYQEELEFAASISIDLSSDNILPYLNVDFPEKVWVRGDRREHPYFYHEEENITTTDLSREDILECLAHKYIEHVQFLLKSVSESSRYISIW